VHARSSGDETPELLTSQVNRVAKTSSWRRSNPDLLQQTQHIKVGPGLRSLAANNAGDRDAGDVDGLASGRDAHQTPGIRTSGCPAGHYPVSFGNLILNHHTEVRK